MAIIKGTQKELNGDLSFSACVSNTDDGNYFRLELNDIESRLRIATIKMSHEDFGRMFAHQTGEKNCKVKLIVNDNFGKRVETKNEMVPIEFSSYDHDIRTEEIKETLKSFEKNGWKVETNIPFHKYDYQNKKQIVHFRRWV